MKQNNWTRSCTQNEAESARKTSICLESVTEKETGNAQPGAWVDVSPRCLRIMYPAWIFYFRWRLIAVGSCILKSLQSTGGTSLENSRHENLRNRKNCFWNKNLTCGLYIWLPNHCYPGKAAPSKNKTKTNSFIYRQTIAKTETLTLYSCVTIIDKLTGQNIACKQALQLGESREVT